jgi:hypothetical protein
VLEPLLGDAIMRAWRVSSASARSVRGRMLAVSAAGLLLAGCAAPNTRGAALSSSSQPGGSSTPGGPVASGSADQGLAGWTFHDTFADYPYSSASGATLGSGDLTMTPHVADPTSCPLLFHGGEVVDISGDGFAPAATVTLMLGLGRAGMATRTVQADADGNVALTVTLPVNLTGLSFGGSTAGYLEADGDGSDSTTRSDNDMFGIGAADATCGATPSITVFLAGPFAPKVSTAGAIFAVTGPGLPTLTRPSKSGTFAELDTDKDGQAMCPPREPSGVICKDGDLGPVEANATYTVTQISAPPNLSIAQPQTMTTDNGIDGPDTVGFLDNYAGTALPASARVNLLSIQHRPLPGSAVFALTGPGLPSLSARPSPGSFAEVDVRAGGWTDCATQEPPRVQCKTGVIENLQPDSSYVMTEVTAPAGYAVAPAQQFVTAADGRVVIVQFVNGPISASPGSG